MVPCGTNSRQLWGIWCALSAQRFGFSIKFLSRSVLSRSTARTPSPFWPPTLHFSAHFLPSLFLLSSSSMMKYIKGDLFSHTPASASAVSILAHACNCRGAWGAGVARVFRTRFPSAYRQYAQHCADHADDPAKLLGTTLLIPTTPGSSGYTLYVACFFTSDFAGAKKLGPQDIVRYTDLATSDLVRQVNELRAKGVNLEDNGRGVVVNMPKINAGLFNVPWEDTEKVLLNYGDLDINVYVID